MKQPTMHITHVIADGSPGGGTTFVLGLCKDLMTFENIEVSLVTQPNSYAFNCAEDLGLKVFGLDMFTSKLDLSLPKKLNDVLGLLSPDIVHVHGGRSAHTLVMNLNNERPYKILYTVHGYHFQKKLQPFRFLGWLSEFLIARRVDLIVFVSNNDKSIASKQGILRQCLHKVIYNGVDYSELCSPNDSLTVDILPKEYDVIFAGRMVLQKNPLFFLDIINVLKSDNLRVVIVGGGDLLDPVKKRAQELGIYKNIIFTGPVERNQLISYLKKSKLYVFPSLWEGLPIGPIEALFCQIPIVASNIGGTNEVIFNGEDGILIDEFNPVLYANAIRDLIVDTHKAQLFSNNGYEKARKIFSRIESSKKYNDLYVNLLSANPNI